MNDRLFNGNRTSVVSYAIPTPGGNRNTGLSQVNNVFLARTEYSIIAFFALRKSTA